MKELDPAASFEEFEQFLVRVYDLHQKKGLPFDVGTVLHQIHHESKERVISAVALLERQKRRELGYLAGNKLLEASE